MHAARGSSTAQARTEGWPSFYSQWTAEIDCRGGECTKRFLKSPLNIGFMGILRMYAKYKYHTIIIIIIRLLLSYIIVLIV